MPITERRAALQPYLDAGLTRSEAYQRYLSSPAANQPTANQRNQQQRNVETRAPVTPLQRTLRRVFSGPTVKPTAPKPTVKPTTPTTFNMTGTALAEKHAARASTQWLKLALAARKHKNP